MCVLKAVRQLELYLYKISLKVKVWKFLAEYFAMSEFVYVGTFSPNNFDNDK